MATANSTENLRRTKVGAFFLSLSSFCRSVFKPTADLRLLTSGLCAALVALSVPAAAQPQVKKIPKIGWLAFSSESALPARYEAFRQGLRDLGYIEGQNIIIVRRDGGRKLHRLPDVAAEMVRLKLEVIVTTGTTAALAAKQATSTVPIVMTTGSDPVALGLIASLSRPGGNITGLTSVATDLAGKRLE